MILEARRASLNWCICLLVVIFSAHRASAQCTIFDNCTNRATAVFYNGTACVCTCANRWAQPDCATCPPAFDAAQDCGACASGYSGTYPNCFRQCTVALDCNASYTRSVSGTTLSGCVCTCFGSAAQPRCDCPSKYEQNPAAQCSNCATGFDQSSYPNCYRSCTVLRDCTVGSTVSVSGNVHDGCHCTCFGYFSSASNCSVCPAQYALPACTACAAGYTGPPPNCLPSCTINGNCSGHAFDVSGQAAVSCTCSCIGGWSPPTCATCPPNWDADNGCATCAAGYFGSACVECSSSYCSFHASNWVPWSGGCNCTCRTHWTGDRCELCPVMYDAANGCDGCNTADGWVDVGGGVCQQLCSISANCSGHASAVVWDAALGCQCTCTNSWAQPACATCPFPINASKDCGDCNTGYTGYPNCVVSTTTPAPTTPAPTTAGPTTPAPTTPAPTTPAPTRKPRVNSTFTATNTTSMSGALTLTSVLSPSRSASPTRSPVPTRTSTRSEMLTPDTLTASASRSLTPPPTPTNTMSASRTWTQSASHFRTPSRSTSTTVSSTKELHDHEEPNLWWLWLLIGLLLAAILIALAIWFLYVKPRRDFARAHPLRREDDETDFRRRRDVDALEAEWCAAQLSTVNLEVDAAAAEMQLKASKS